MASCSAPADHLGNLSRGSVWIAALNFSGASRVVCLPFCGSPIDQNPNARKELFEKRLEQMTTEITLANEVFPKNCALDEADGNKAEAACAPGIQRWPLYDKISE